MKRITSYLVLLGVIAFGLSATPRSGYSQQDPLPEPAPESSPVPTPKTKFVKKQKNVVPNHYIVVLKDDVAPDDLPIEVRRARVTEIAKSHAEAHHGTVYYIYETALKGYSIELPNEAAAIAISKLAIVRWVEEDAMGEWPSGTIRSDKPSVKSRRPRR